MVSKSGFRNVCFTTFDSDEKFILSSIMKIDNFQSSEVSSEVGGNTDPPLSSEDLKVLI